MRVITVFILHNIVFSTEYTAFAATYVERCVRLGRSLGAARHLHVAIQRVVETRHRYGKKIALAVWRCNGDLLERQ